MILYIAQKITYHGIGNNAILLPQCRFGVHAKEYRCVVRCSHAARAVECMWGSVAPLRAQLVFTTSRQASDIRSAPTRQDTRDCDLFWIVRYVRTETVQGTAEVLIRAPNEVGGRHKGLEREEDACNCLVE